MMMQQVMRQTMKAKGMGALVLAGMSLSLASGCVEKDEQPNTNPGEQAGAELKSSEQRVVQPSVPTADQDALADGNEAFSFSMYQQLKPGDTDNVIYSPHSISIALAMTYAGARGNTAKEMADALHYTLPDAQLHPAFNLLDQQLASRGQGAQGSDGEPFRLKVANSIWGQQGYHFEPDFLDTLALNYGAGLRVLDFEGDADGSRQTINKWVEAKTEERIKDLLPQGSIDSSTRLVLTNAVYFNAAWASKFEEQSTRDAEFTKLDGAKSTVKMMYQMERFKHAKHEDGTEVLSMPYDGGELDMVLILPAPEQFKTIEQGLSPEMFKLYTTGLEEKLVDVFMPRFKFEYKVALSEKLKELGMKDAFTGAADLSGMNGKGGLAISEVFHKAFVGVNEAGTEAAAATAVVVGETSVPTVDARFELNRPFLFAIRDVKTRAILFMGRVVAP